MSKEYLEKIKNAVINGDKETSVNSATEALLEGVKAYSILHEGLIAGADAVGQRFETGEIFLPELMRTGNALKAAIRVIAPQLKEEYLSGEAVQEETGVVVIATIQTDLHDIGKNIISSMFTASGFDVFDMGVDVPVMDIINKAREVNADIIACSALLTTSLPYMGDLITLMIDMGIRDQYIVMVGGAPVTPRFASDIGSDGWATNPIQAIQLARDLILSKKLNNGSEE